MARVSPGEVRALAGLVDELDYYELLEVERDAPSSQVRRAYHALSRRFHPDANRELPEDARASLQKIAKRVTEAYSVLRDARLRRSYDERLAGGAEGARRIRLVEAEAQSARRDADERLGTTAQGRQFFLRARSDLERGELASASRNLQTALTFEPGNALFRDTLAEVKAKLG